MQCGCWGPPCTRRTCAPSGRRRPSHRPAPDTGTLRHRQRITQPIVAQLTLPGAQRSSNPSVDALHHRPDRSRYSCRRTSGNPPRRRSPQRRSSSASGLLAATGRDRLIPRSRWNLRSAWPIRISSVRSSAGVSSMRPGTGRSGGCPRRRPATPVAPSASPPGSSPARKSRARASVHSPAIAFPQAIAATRRPRGWRSLARSHRQVPAIDLASITHAVAWRPPRSQAAAMTQDRLVRRCPGSPRSSSSC